MKKILFSTLIALSLFIVSCSNDKEDIKKETTKVSNRGSLDSHSYVNYWEQLPNVAGVDIGVGKDGSVYVIGVDDDGNGGAGIYKVYPNWQKLDGVARRLSVQSDGNLWVVNGWGAVYQRVPGRGWVYRSSPSSSDISVSRDGKVFTIGTDNDGVAGPRISEWLNTYYWYALNERAVKVAVDHLGNPWVVQKNGSIFKRESGIWTQLPGSATDVGISANGTAFIVGSDDDGVKGGQIYRWDYSSWTLIEGARGTSIAVDPSGMPWIVDRTGAIIRYKSQFIDDGEGENN